MSFLFGIYGELSNIGLLSGLFSITISPRLVIILIVLQFREVSPPSSLRFSIYVR